MAFESLSEKLGSIFKNLRSKGKLTEDDVKKVMREIILPAAHLRSGHRFL